MLSPTFSAIFNFVAALFGAAETSGLTNMLGNGKGGIVAAMVIAFVNAGLHGISPAVAGPLVSTQPPPPSGGMRTMGLFILGLLLLWPTGSYAADVVVKKAPTASTYVDPWAAGLYGGGEIGYGMNLGREVFQGLDLGVESGAKAQGMLGGMVLGYGGRISGPIYAGVEVTGSYAGMNGGAGLSAVQASDKVDWLASARGRIGYIYDRVMLYGTGGWGWGGTKKDFLVIATGADPSTAKVQNGFVWGLGAEYALTNQWLARVEYRQYLFGTATAADAVATYSVHDNINTFTGGMVYKF